MAEKMPCRVNVSTTFVTYVDLGYTSRIVHRMKLPKPELGLLLFNLLLMGLPTTKAYTSFCSIKQLGSFSIPPMAMGGMSVHRRFHTSIRI